MYAVFGDSYISWLNRFNKDGLHNFHGRCKLYGVSGMTTTRKFEPEFQKMLNDRPRYVFMNLGGNDINATCSVEEIVTRLIRIVQRLKQNGVERVFVASIVERESFPDFTGLNSNRFNKIRRSVNAKLQLHFGEDYVNVEKKLKYPKHYNDDLVHPGSKEGGLKVLNSIIKASFMKTF